MWERTRLVRSSLLAAAASLTAGCTGCLEPDEASRSLEEAKQDPTPPEDPAPAPVDPIADTAVATALERELGRARGVPPDSVEVAMEDGVAELDGVVPHALARARAARIVASVTGVKGVVNRLRVAPTRRSDAQVKGDVQAALAADPATDSWEIRADVEGGTVRLEGRVASWHERALAEKVTMSVVGVRDVDNRLTLEEDLDDPRTDAEIETEIERALMWDARVDDGLIDAKVEGGVVTLSGAVGSVRERQLAITDAWTRGVTEVNAEDLVVDWRARDALAKRQRFAGSDTEDVKKAVVAALRADPRVQTLPIGVKVDGGQVTLTGEVSSLKTRRAAARTAASVVGVLDVDNLLEVRVKDTPAGESLAEDVREALARDPYLEDDDVQVEATGARVTLSGRVQSFFEKWQAEDAAARVTGVIAIDNDIAVGYGPVAAGLTYYDWDAVETDRDPRSTTAELSDETLRDRVREELRWSPGLDPDDIEVEVDDGVVTLRGLVDTWWDQTDAMEEAYEAGASAVNNDLVAAIGPEL